VLSKAESEAGGNDVGILEKLDEETTGLLVSFIKFGTGYDT